MIASIARGDLLVIFRYLVVGASSVAIYVGCSAILHRGLSLEPLASNAAGYVIATTFNYMANFYWAFAASRPHAAAIWRFLAVVLAGMACNSLFAATMLALTPLPVEVIAVLFAVLWPAVSFASLRFWALR